MVATAQDADESFRHPSSHQIARSKTEVLSFVPLTGADSSGWRKRPSKHGWVGASIHVSGLPGFEDGPYSFAELSSTAAVFCNKEGSCLELALPKKEDDCPELDHPQSTDCEEQQTCRPKQLPSRAARWSSLAAITASVAGAVACTSSNFGWLGGQLWNRGAMSAVDLPNDGLQKHDAPDADPMEPRLGNLMDCTPIDALPTGTKLAVYPVDLSSAGIGEGAKVFVEVSESERVFLTYEGSIFLCGHARQLGFLPETAQPVLKTDVFW